MTDTTEQNWFSEDQATLGDRLAGARDAAMMSPEQLAEKLGVNVETLRDWEQDLQEPRANRLAMIAGLLNVSLQWLLTGTGDGLDQPIERNSELEAALDIVTEIQVVRQDVATQLDRLAELEVRLRTALKDGA